MREKCGLVSLIPSCLLGYKLAALSAPTETYGVSNYGRDLSEDMITLGVRPVCGL